MKTHQDSVTLSNSTTDSWLTWLRRGLLALLGLFTAYGLWRLGRYWQLLLGQPRLLPVVIPETDEEALTTLEAQALHIASANLQAGIEPRQLLDGQEKLVLCAGMRNFREPWARDFGFASFGLLALEQTNVVRDNLDVFLAYQQASGQFPVKVHSTSIVDRYLHSLFGREQPTRAPIKPKFTTAHRTVSLDGNALLVISALNYARQVNDQPFVESHWASLRQGLTWLEQHISPKTGLLHQEPYADWADSVARQGAVLYPNVLYWKATHDLATAARQYGFDEESETLEAQAESLKATINDHFWHEELGYFTAGEAGHLSSDGNVLAVAWGLTSPQQSAQILDQMTAWSMAHPVPTQVVYPPYASSMIAIENRLGGIGNYHTSAAWLWLGAWHVIALVRQQRLAQADELLQRIAHVIVRDGAVHEVYAPDGNHLSSFWYTSESPLTWSAGMVVYAFHVYNQAAQQANKAGKNNAGQRNGQ